MNELEIQNLHEHTIHKSVLVLLFKGGFAWLLLAALDYGFYALILYLPGTNLATFTNIQTLSSPLPLFHFILNFLFGWLLLYVILDWVFEYYIIKEDSIVVRQGIIFSHENVYQIEDVKTIEVNQGFFGKIFKIGTVHFYAYRAQKHIYLNNISNPNTIAAHIHELHPAPETVHFPKK
jgi:membrane protein YdbS with pleckstrin-like domain